MCYIMLVLTSKFEISQPIDTEYKREWKQRLIMHKHIRVSRYVMTVPSQKLWCGFQMST